MGLLDRLAADLISSSIGVSPRVTRTLVRKAVGSPLLLAGGAALAGALISEMARGQQAGAATGPSTWAPPPPPGAAAAAAVPTWVPPPPPLPTSPPPSPAPSPPDAATAPAWSPPPPPPPPGATGETVEPAVSTPADGSADEGPEIPPAVLYAAVRTMVAAALADGTLAAAERGRIQEHLGSGELAEEQAAQVRRDLLLPASPAELAGMVSTEGERELLYRFAALVVMTDAGTSPTEAIWLGSLAAALGLPAERARALERELLA